MKKFLTVLLSLVLICTSFAMAEMPATGDMPRIDGQVSATTGLVTDKPDRTMVVQMDNEPGARPQMGIGSADIVYEIETYNGGYTRYTAVFNDVIPEKVEAVRSARMVHVDVYKEYGGAFIHYGAQYAAGSNAEEYMDQVGMDARYDGIKGISGFYRDNSRKAPNNVVCELKELYDKTDWSNFVGRSPLKFSDSAYTAKGDAVTDFGIVYRDGSYHPSYTFKDGLYYRFYNGNPHNDGQTGEQLAFSNVIVHHVAYSWYDGDGDRPVVTTMGSNRCDYFIDGTHFTGYWERDNVSTSTRYYDDEGNEVVFKPGKTFIQVLKEGKEISYAG